MHAGVVHDVLAIGDLRIFLGDIPRAAQKQAVGHLHDVGFVDGENFLAFLPARVFEGKARNACGSLFGDDLQRLHHARNHFVLNAGIFAFGVFPHDDQVYAWITRRDTRQVANGPKIGKQLKLFSQGNIDAGKSLPDRRGHRPLQPDPVPFDGFQQLFGEIFFVLFVSLGAGGVTLPLESHSC